MPGKQRRASESSSLSNWPLKAAGKPSFCYSNELKEGAHLRSMEPAMVLEVPNKSSNILNTFGLSKSHRSGNPSPRASPRLPAAAASSLLPWLLPSRTRARVLRLH